MKPTQDPLGIVRPDPGPPSKWRGPRETPTMQRRRLAREQAQRARDAAPAARDVSEMIRGALKRIT